MRTSVKLMAAAAMALGLAAAPVLRADVTDGSFESGTLNSWNQIGDASVQSNTYGQYFGAPEGDDVAFLNNDPTGFNQYGNNPATEDVAALDTFSGLAPGTLETDNVKSGSAISQTFTASGSTLSFEYNFLTNETPSTNQDFGYMTISGTGIVGTEFIELANPTTPAGSMLSSPGATNYGIYQYTGYGTGTETGYLTYDLPGLTTGGTYTVAFGVTNVGDTSGASGLLIDSVSTAAASSSGGSGGGSSVPLPAAALLAPAALAMAGRYSKKLRKQA